MFRIFAAAFTLIFASTLISAAQSTRPVPARRPAVTSSTVVAVNTPATMENIRLKLVIEEIGKPPSTFTILTSQGMARLNNLCKAEEIGGNTYPIMVQFTARMSEKEGKYTIVYTYGIQKPFITSSRLSEGKPQVNVQYKDIGSEGSVVMKLGETYELVKDPRQTVKLSIEKVTAAQ